MNPPTLPLLGAAALLALARDQEAQAAPCGACGPLGRPGWESLSGSDDTSSLRRVATLRDPRLDEPTLDEYHPAGTHAWSPDAPIAPAWSPSNRCDLWRCSACGRPFLRYTEYGGYYEDERIRPLQASLIVDVPAP